MLKLWATNIIFVSGLLLFFMFKAPLQLSYWYLPVWIALYLAILGAGVYFIGLNFHLRSQNKLNTNAKTVALTFDDGPHHPNTAKVLDVLQKHQVKATFFIIGKNIAEREELMQRLVVEGHQVGNHSFSHDTWFDLWSTKKITRDVRQCQDLLRQYQSTDLFRPPYGITTPNIRRALKTLDLRSIGWNIRSYDTSAGSMEQVKSRIMKQLRPGAIILLHDRLEMAPELLEELIPAIREQQYNFSLII